MDRKRSILSPLRTAFIVVGQGLPVNNYDLKKEEDIPNKDFVKGGIIQNST